MAKQQMIRSAKDLGTTIRTRRKALGYTQTQVAEALGFSARLVGEIERGRGTVAFERVLAYARELGIDLFSQTRGE